MNLTKKIIFYTLFSIILIFSDNFIWFILKYTNLLMDGLLGLILFSILYLIIFILLIKSIKLLIKNRHSLNILCFIPFIELITVICLITFIPFTDIYSITEFNIKYSEREKIVNLVKNQKLNQTDYYSYMLPISDFYLSKNGYIEYDKENNNEIIIFPMHRLSSESIAVVYSSNNTLDNGIIYYTKTDILKSKNIKNNWFIVTLNESI